MVGEQDILSRNYTPDGAGRLCGAEDGTCLHLNVGKDASSELSPSLLPFYCGQGPLTPDGSTGHSALGW